MVLLNQPTQMDIWGNTLSHGPQDRARNRHRANRHSLAMARRQGHQALLDGERRRSCLYAKAAFNQSQPTRTSACNRPRALQVRINERFDLRLGLFGDFHFSDGFIVPVNPGLDVMNATMGLTYHLTANGNSPRIDAPCLRAEAAPRSRPVSTRSERSFSTVEKTIPLIPIAIGSFDILWLVVEEHRLLRAECRAAPAHSDRWPGRAWPREVDSSTQAHRIAKASQVRAPSARCTGRPYWRRWPSASRVA